MKLEEVLPALRAGRNIKRKKWVDLELNGKLKEKLNENCDLLADDWEIVGEECYQDGLKLPTTEDQLEKKNSEINLLNLLDVRVNLLEKKLSSFQDWRRAFAEDLYNYIDNKLEMIHDMLRIDNKRLHDLETRFNELNIEERLSKLEKDFESKLDADYIKCVKYFNYIEENKNPHKCVACNGLGFRTIFRDYPPGYSENFPCAPCDGKGVLWK